VVGVPYATSIVATDTMLECNNVLLGGIGNEDVRVRPEYRLMEKQVALKHEAVKIARADYLPTAGLSAGMNYLGGVQLMGEDYTSNNVSVMANVSIPIFHWGQGHRKISSAKIQAEMQQLELDKNAQLLLLETEQAKLNLQDAFVRIGLAEENLGQANENLEVSKNNYEAGMEEMTAYLIAQTQWQEAYAELIDAKTDFKVKETVYLKTTGRLGN
jgi:outer membrane protein TolC